MKKLILVICFLLMSGQAWGTTYYGGAAGKNINADDLWYVAVSGSCTGSGSPVAWSTVGAGTHTLIANGCTITIPNTADATFTAAKISNKTDGGSNVVDGGGFTYETSADYAVSLIANVEAGGTTGAALAISGTADGAARFTLGANGNVKTVTGGSGSSIYGISDSHTVGGTVYYANITGGSHASGYGLYITGATGSKVINGSGTGGTAAGITARGTSGATVNGDCTGGAAALASGCEGYGGPVTVTGNIIASAKALGAAGLVVWTPATPADGVTGHYISLCKNSTCTTAGTDFIYIGANTDDAAKALTTFYYIDPTDGTSDQGSASSGGGGAWGF